MSLEPTSSPILHRALDYALRFDDRDRTGRRTLSASSAALRSVRVVQRLLDPLTVRFGADHLVRAPLDYLAGVGFEIYSVQRLKAGIVERVLAHRPDGASSAPQPPVGAELPPR